MTTYKKTLEAVIPITEPVPHTYREVEWRRDGVYDAKTGERVAVLSSPRDMQPPRKKKLEARLYSLEEVLSWEDSNDDEV